MFNDSVAMVNAVLWGKGQLLIYMLLFAGIWFSTRLRLIQIRHFGHMFGLLKHSTRSDKSGISSFQALCTSLSARVGTGNLAGVAIAISLGGPGAIFWMWVIAFIGMATGFAESLLAQVYKVRDNNQEFRGGPAYYIQQGLGWRWMAVTFSLCLLFGYGFIFGATQANTIADALNYAYGFPVFNTGLAVTVLAGLIILGGLRAIARFSELVVPIMGVAYLLVVVGITLWNITAVPAMLFDIVSSAFGLQEAAAGTFGAALKNGIQRGLYSNEAGTGAAPQAAACATPSPNHPASQGYIQMLGVFLDTMVLCTCSAIIILLAGGASSGEMEGIRLTQDAMNSHIGGYGIHFVSVAICLFAFTSIVANYAYAEANLHLFKLDTSAGRTVLTVIFLGMILWGSGSDLKDVWAAADMAFGLMAVINIVAIILLTPTIVAISKDYHHKREKRLPMEYRTGDCRIQGESEQGIWD
ncbi:MAG: alanine:cation symporter family protein [Gammaproteobacteria bacterium]|nr:alanine:cation symporter family protein [Gammaproteobacteria bacterium]